MQFVRPVKCSQNCTNITKWRVISYLKEFAVARDRVGSRLLWELCLILVEEARDMTWQRLSVVRGFTCWNEPRFRVLRVARWHVFAKHEHFGERSVLFIKWCRSCAHGDVRAGDWFVLSRGFWNSRRYKCVHRGMLVMCRRAFFCMMTSLCMIVALYASVRSTSNVARKMHFEWLLFT